MRPLRMKTQDTDCVPCCFEQVQLKYSCLFNYFVADNSIQYRCFVKQTFIGKKGVVLQYQLKSFPRRWLFISTIYRKLQILWPALEIAYHSSVCDKYKSLCTRKSLNVIGRKFLFLPRGNLCNNECDNFFLDKISWQKSIKFRFSQSAYCLFFWNLPVLFFLASAKSFTLLV